MLSATGLSPSRVQHSTASPSSTTLVLLSHNPVFTELKERLPTDQVSRIHYAMNSELFSALLKVKPLFWQRIFEGPRIIKGMFSKLTLIILDGLTKEMCIASHLLTKQILFLINQSGILLTSLYLKQCSTSLMLWRGSVRPLPRDLSVPVSLTRSGLPRIIPAFHRREIRSRSPKGDTLIRFYLSAFTIIKLMLVAKAVSRKT
ncbi:hypothetical protein Syun_031852 [Stephania yunnanensis]|uniref:Uncharacterized protein n=1 Tax=Stephania yunnanensis TaxID=152371 RepID=A0AAP0E058_9MAGN